MLKTFLVSGITALTLVVGMPAWCHHAAEGIVTDEIWLMVDENLDGSGHEIVFEDIWASMDVDDSDNGQMALTSEVVVDDDAVDIYLEAIFDAMEDISRIPSGTRSGGMPVIDVDVVDIVGPTTVITLWEPIGSGDSQEIPPMPGAGN